MEQMFDVAPRAGTGIAHGCLLRRSTLTLAKRSDSCMSTPLSDDDFSQIVRLVPLVSIDLIIRDANRNVLVALRTNEPAKGVYFVPGGCIRKNETIENAFVRILRNETGCHARFADARFLGVFQHFYSTSRYGLSGNGTHYIVLAYEVRFNDRPTIALDDQHSSYRWMNEPDLKAAYDVHDNTKAFFY
jgi:colanic acid biosynthesis protein WcaH